MQEQNASPNERAPARGTGQLLADGLRFLVKLLIDAARDVVLIPLTIGALVLDLLLSRNQSPRFFYAVLALGERSERLIDLWSALYERAGPAPDNVDQVIDQIEAAIRDPQQGKRRARVLKRWLERRMRRQAAGMQAAASSARAGLSGGRGAGGADQHSGSSGKQTEARRHAERPDAQ